jgi:hypothetical protein
VSTRKPGSWKSESSRCTIPLLSLTLMLATLACVGGFVEQPEPTRAPSATATLTPTPTDPPPTDTPTSTSTPTPTFTPAPTLPPSFTPTPTPNPTATPNPMLVQGHAFADPILAAIADRAPFLADNFDSGSGWYVGVQEDREGPVGETGYADGEYYIIAYPGHMSNAQSVLVPFVSDFVMEVDARFVEGGDGEWQAHLRHRALPSTDSCSGYMANIELGGNISLERYDHPQVLDLTPELPAFAGGYASHHTVIVMHDSRLAVFVDGRLVAYANDGGYTDQFESGNLHITVWNLRGGTPLRLHLDNLKVWDISDL